MKCIIVYVFHEYNERVKFFINNTIFKHPDYDFVVVCNGNIYLDVPPYVSYINRENKGLDFGAWSYVLLTDDMYKNYDYVICINSSCMGPFLPSYCKDILWPEIFIEKLKGDVKLVGPTINDMFNPNKSHVQSYMFAMDRDAFELLVEKGVFSLNIFPGTKEKLIEKCEVGMSRHIIDAGYNIASIHYYKDVDFRNNPQKSCKFVGDHACVLRNFFGESLHPYEVVFLKVNRGNNMEWILKFSP